MPLTIQTKKTNKHKEQQKKYTRTLKTGTCKFPFDYGGKTYTECHPGTETRKGKWCATSLEKGKKTLKTWAFCKEPSTPKSKPVPVPKPVSKSVSPKKSSSTSKLPPTPKPHVIDTMKIEKGANSLLIGSVQSGKTESNLKYCLRSKREGLKTLYILRNINADVKQLQVRLEKDRLNDNPKFSELTFTPINNIVKPVSHLLKRIILDINVEPYDVFLGKMNMEDLKKFFYLAKYHGFEFNVVVDEGDLLSGEEKKTERAMSMILNLPNRHNFLHVTATPLANILSSDVNYYYKLKEPGPDDYVGIRHPRITFNSTAETEGNKTEKKNLNRSEMVRILKTGESKRICITLLISEPINKDQKADMEYLLTQCPKYAGIVYNQESTREPLIKFNGKLLSVNRKPTITDLITKALTRTNHIFIVAGLAANRGISFTETIVDDQKPKYHLTDLYLKDKASGHCEELIQKLRILGKYKNEHRDYKSGKEEQKLNIWCTPDFEREINRCYDLIEKLTNLLVTKTEEGFKFTTKKQINEVLEIAKIRQRDLPTVALTREKYDNFKSFVDAPQILNLLTSQNGIDYYKKVFGYSLKPLLSSHHSTHRNLDNCNVIVRRIIFGLSRNSDVEITHSLNDKLYNLYYKDCLLPKNRDEIFKKRDLYIKTKSAKDLKDLNGLLENNCKEYTDTYIFPEQASFISTRQFKQIKLYRDHLGLENLSSSNFRFRSYLDVDLEGEAASFKNYSVMINKYKKKENTEILEFGPSKFKPHPFTFSYATTSFRDGLTNSVPLVWSIYVPHEFVYGTNTYPSFSVRNENHYWYNLKGELYLNPKRDKFDTKYRDGIFKIMQIKDVVTTDQPKPFNSSLMSTFTEGTNNNNNVWALNTGRYYYNN